MTAVLDTPAALLAELTALGIELQPHGERLRFRPQSAMTAELVARVKVHKPGLLALLADAETPAGDTTTPGFGSGVGDMLTATSYAADEARMLADAPADMRAVVEAIKCMFPGAELVSVQRTAPEPPLVDAAAWPTADDAGTLPAGAADLARKRDGWTPATWRGRLLYLADACAALHPDRAAELRRAAIALTPGLVEAFEERAAIMEHDAGLPREDAEAAAWTDTLRPIADRNIVALSQLTCYDGLHGRSNERDPDGDRSERAYPLSHREGNGHRREPAFAACER